jgi:hypothetical protein
VLLLLPLLLLLELAVAFSCQERAERWASAQAEHSLPDPSHAPETTPAQHRAGFGGSLSKASILEWADAGGNLLVALAPGASDLVRGLAADLGVEVDAKGTRLYDHFSRQAAGGATDPSLVATSAWIDSDAFLGAARPSSPVLFRGVAQAVPTSSELVGGGPGGVADELLWGAGERKTAH